MEERTYKVYKFSELSEELKEKVLDKYRYWHVEDDYWHESYFDCLADTNNEHFKDTGLKYVSCSFSGFCSQGDGASVEYEIENKEQFVNYLARDTKMQTIARRYLKWAPDYIDCNSTTQRWRGGYSRYEHYEPIEFTTYGFGKTKYLDMLVKHLNENSEEFHRDLCSNVYRELEKEYDSLTSDETLTEYFMEIDGDYMFKEDGGID